MFKLTYLLAILALFSGAHAGSFPFIPPPPGSVTTGPGTDSGTISVGVKCTAQANAQLWAAAKSARIYQTVRIVKHICDKRYRGDIKKVRANAGIAYAGVKSLAKVSVKCSYKGTPGQAQGCALATAWSGAYAEAWLEGKAKAEVEASLNSCYCGTSVTVEAEAIAKLSADLWAHANSDAKAQVCRAGSNTSNKAEAYNNCVAEIDVDFVVKAVAKLMLDDDCRSKDWGTSLDSWAEARAVVKANIDATYTKIQQCEEFELAPTLCGGKCFVDQSGTAYADIEVLY